jgi:phosphatidylserine decarboxylase
MNDSTIVTLLSIVPKGLGSKLQGLVGRSGLSRHIIRWYADRYGVNTDEMVGTLDDYPSLQEFFVRPLRPGLRPIDQAPDALVSPSDSRVYAFGTVQDDGHLPEDAGLDFDVVKLVGGDQRYKGGQFAVLYLSPKDYHRVHHPADGQVSRWHYLPGQFWPVFEAATKEIPGLFAVNERLTVFVDTQSAGRIAVVLVAAYGVGRMTCEHCDIVTNTDGKERSEDLHIKQPVQRGQELGRFNLGSTVILVTEPGAVEWELTKDDNVKVGQRIARLSGGV